MKLEGASDWRNSSAAAARKEMVESWIVFHSEGMISCLCNKTLKNQLPFSQIGQFLKKKSRFLKLYQGNNINEIALGKLV